MLRYYSVQGIQDTTIYFSLSYQMNHFRWILKPSVSFSQSTKLTLETPNKKWANGQKTCLRSHWRHHESDDVTDAVADPGLPEVRDPDIHRFLVRIEAEGVQILSWVKCRGFERQSSVFLFFKLRQSSTSFRPIVSLFYPVPQDPKNALGQACSWIHKCINLLSIITPTDTTLIVLRPLMHLGSK